MRIAFVLLFAISSLAHAHPAPPDAAPSTAKPADEFNFELTPPGEQKPQPSLVQSEADKLHLAKLEQRVHLRRSMLLAHQVFGFVTLGALAATSIIGTLHYVDKYGGGPDDDRYKDAHLGLGISTTALFTTTAMLALFAPNPYPKPVKFDTAFIHKASMAIAAAAFLAQIVLGPISALADGKLYQKNLALAHNVIGWGAFGFMTIGTLAYVVK